MPFEKGHNLATGRPKGTPNIITNELRNLCKETLQEEIIWFIENKDQFDPHIRLQAMFKLASFVLPKVVSINSDKGEPFDLNF
tara:strand:- start:4 stop:252 length:249 start_codon:yes stop_codon:yes gene_type:complete